MLIAFWYCLPWLLTSVQAAQKPFNVEHDLNQAGHLRRFSVRDASHIEELLQLTEDHNLDVWQVTPSHIDVYFPPTSLALPAALSIHPNTKTDISTTLPSPVTTATDWNLSTLVNTTYHATYHPLFEIDNFMYDIKALHPELVKVVPLGHSGEGREMLGMTISKPDRFIANDNIPLRKGRRTKHQASVKKMGFVVLGAQHAREWVATSTALYLAHALVTNASEPHSLTHLLDFYDFHIFPSPNPDGYEYTWESDRFWYKNRMNIGPTAECVGLDMNRNWGYKWKPVARQFFSSNSSQSMVRRPPVDPCSHWYPGHRAFEAPEVNNIANYISNLPNLKAFVDLRSYGQMLSSPFSYTCKKDPKDAEDQLEASLGAVHALRQVHGTPFMTGTLCSLLYQAPGNVVDWMYAKAGVKFAYAAHTRDTGTYGFALPAEWIRPVGEETAKMVEYLAQFIVKHLG